jgi:eukaryotic-like serine/threonine-protein kinase
MPYVVPMDQAEREYPEFKFVQALTPSEQKAAFHVTNQTGEDLCLKLIAPNYDPDRFHREIQAMQAISHSNVVKLREYTFTSSPGKQRHYVVEEFVAGDDLTAHLHPGKAWPDDRAVQFFAALCDGLAALKDQGVVHRDLKPSNIRVRADGSPVIIDFGLARHLQLVALTKTSQGAQIGTPLYFAPEQFVGTKHDIDHRTDLFAVGVLLYEALVGQHPFLRPTMTSLSELQDSVCNSQEFLQVPAFQQLPKSWRLLIGRLLDKERARRPTDAAQVARLIRKIGGMP